MRTLRLALPPNPQRGHELRLTTADVASVEDVLAKISGCAAAPCEWAQRLLTAHLAGLLTYLRRLYAEQLSTFVFLKNASSRSKPWLGSMPIAAYPRNTTAS